MIPDFFQFYSPTKVVFGRGLSKDLSAEIAPFPKRLFVVTDQGLQKAGLIDPVLEGLKKGGFLVAGLFSQVPPNSEVEAVKQCAHAAREVKAGALFAIGGGSVIDTAKGANILFSLGGDLVGDYSGAQTINRPLSPWVAIPTTAGTGSEVSSAAVIYDAKSRTKLSFVDDHLYPTVAVLDPGLTDSLPPKLTAATGMDALTHAIESYVSLQKNPVSDAFAVQAAQWIKKYLVQAVENGKDPEARSGMLIAATMAGFAFDRAMVGVVHAMAHAAGGVAGVHHGTANNIFLPWGMEFNRSVREAEYASLAVSLQCAPVGVSSAEGYEALMDFVLRLRERLHQLSGLPYRLRDVGIDYGQLEAIAEGAVADGTTFYNPREVVKDELLKVIEKAL